MKAESFPNNQEHFPFEVKLSVYVTLDEIKEKLASNRPINFLATKDSTIWLTDGTHNSLTDNGVTWSDIDSLGFIKMNGGKLEFKFYDEPTNSRDVKNSILNFLKL